MIRGQSRVAAPAGRSVVGRLGRCHAEVCGGGKERLACIEIDQAEPFFFNTHLSAMLTKTEQKFYFSSPSSCTTPPPFSTPLGTPLGGSLPEFWTTGGHVLGLDAPYFFPS